MSTSRGNLLTVNEIIIITATSQPQQGKPYPQEHAKKKQNTSAQFTIVCLILKSKTNKKVDEKFKKKKSPQKMKYRNNIICLQ